MTKGRIVSRSSQDLRPLRAWGGFLTGTGRIKCEKWLVAITAFSAISNHFLLADSYFTEYRAQWVWQWIDSRHS